MQDLVFDKQRLARHGFISEHTVNGKGATHGSFHTSVMSILKCRKIMLKFLHNHSRRADYEEIRRDTDERRARSVGQFGVKGEA